MLGTKNEWDPLKRVIIGSAKNANWPVMCKDFREQDTAWTETPIPMGPIDKNIINEAEEDLQNFATLLEGFDVKVEKPKDLDFQYYDGMYNYCPRDRFVVIDEHVISAPMMYESRIMEMEAYMHLFPDFVECDDLMAVFDAANICRLGKDILYLESCSGNLAGAYWLRDFLGDDYRVHVLDSYSGVHIDSTISPVREGLAIVNKDRVKELPEPMKNWDIIWMGKDDIVSRDFIDYPYASNYIALNTFSIDPENIVCDPYQKKLHDKLNKYNVNVHTIDLRHSRTLGGGHHCVTLDMMRCG